MHSIKLTGTWINARISCFKVSNITQNIDKVNKTITFALISSFKIARPNFENFGIVKEENSPSLQEYSIIIW